MTSLNTVGRGCSHAPDRTNIPSTCGHTSLPVQQLNQNRIKQHTERATAQRSADFSGQYELCDSIFAVKFCSASYKWSKTACLCTGRVKTREGRWASGRSCNDASQVKLVNSSLFLDRASLAYYNLSSVVDASKCRRELLLNLSCR